jgi:hypothetical protein
MRHIKIFEMFDPTKAVKNEFYQEISYSEYNKLTDWGSDTRRGNVVKITDSEVERLEDIIGVEVERMIPYDDDRAGKWIKFEIKKDRLPHEEGPTDRGSEIDIMKGDDDWYYVWMELFVYTERKDKEWYKCDQFEGLVKLLKDKGYTNK